MSIGHFVEKVRVFITSFNQISLDFYLQETSSNKTHFLNSSLTYFLAFWSSKVKGPIPSLESQNNTSFKAISFSEVTLSNASLF